MLGHLLLFLGSGTVLWFLSGLLIDAVDRVAKRYNKPGFAVAFFVLGFLTSIGETSVLVNASIEGVPQVSAGNLLGASTVIFLLLIPVLAVLGNGIPMTRALIPSNVALLLLVVLAPSLLLLKGGVHATDGVLLLLLYAALVYRLRKRRPSEELAEQVLERAERELLGTRRATAMDVSKIVGGALLIFLAGNVLVEESVYFAGVLHIPLSYVGLLVLSIGTNIPEIVIAIRCVLGRRKDIAFGDYLGSAAANTPLFGLLALLNGPFAFDASEAIVTSVILGIGLVLFFVFSRSKHTLSRLEGALLLALYVLFLTFQINNAVRLSGEPEPDGLRNGAPEISRRVL